MQSIRTNTTKANITFFKLIGNEVGSGKKISACNLFSELAVETWERFQFAYESEGFKIYETTITQNLLYQIEKVREYLDVKIILREAVDEKTNGNDIEFVITDGAKSIKMPMQAKRIYKNLRYSSISHEGQIDDLIKYAKKVKGIPMYLLYNYKQDYFDRVDLCSIQSDQRQYGCSLIDAIYIREKFTTKAGRSSSRKWRVPKFKDLVPSPSIPWIVIPCCSAKNFGSKEEVFDVLKIEDDCREQLDYVEFQAHEDIMKESAWKELDLYQKKEPGFSRENENKEPENKSYKPGFQIIINID